MVVIINSTNVSLPAFGPDPEVSVGATSYTPWWAILAPTLIFLAGVIAIGVTLYFSPYRKTLSRLFRFRK
ncbi:hypothetical protein [Metallosphaera hakonensis]|uniref:Uncharacterized protein n=1 Tax=Metallosphaera hakonensis JCM 8857 = DSM 7519 TaxID=1293036 RepID=A0A2U9ITR3_9CREN|nr:hypothetical protein [Metallosphaera hakonensis]AWR99365.1 hypothetical protein DFR87_06205 [Metallosphaera hakonensis JCM 8857 = DSM 7519]